MRSKDLLQQLELVCSCPSSCWCGNPSRFSLHLVQVLVRTGFPLYLEQVNIDTIILHRKRKEVTVTYKSLAVCNIATRSYCLLEFHFRPVGLVLQTVSLEEDTLVRHMHKYKFTMWLIKYI